MTISVIVNNYMLGAKVKSTPVDKIVVSERIDSKHVKITYSGISDREAEFIGKVLQKKVTIEDK